jgi:hypothetical protein
MGISRRAFALALFVCAAPLWPQEGGAAADPAALIGLRLEALLSRFGAPRAVYAARGTEEWQDDVVFVYGEGDFYVFRDRVWQIGLKSYRGIKIGDSKPAAMLILGGEARDEGGSIVLPLPSKDWPLALRIGLNSAGFVSALHVYRSDF